MTPETRKRLEAVGMRHRKWVCYHDPACVGGGDNCVSFPQVPDLTFMAGASAGYAEGVRAAAAKVYEIAVAPGDFVKAKVVYDGILALSTTPEAGSDD